MNEYETRMARDREEARLAQARRFWHDNCPAAYKETDPAKLPKPVPAGIVAAWTYGPKGLLLVGESRSGKTRSAWLRIKGLSKEGRSVMAFDGLSWFVSVARSFSDLETTDNFFHGVVGVDVLFLDDIFRGRMTEAQDVALWGVIERRMAAERPLIVTTNATGKTLEDRCGAQIVPVIARLRECCHVVSF